MKVSGAVAMADDPGHAFGIYFEKIEPFPAIGPKIAAMVEAEREDAARLTPAAGTLFRVQGDGTLTLHGSVSTERVPSDFKFEWDVEPVKFDAQEEKPQFNPSEARWDNAFSLSRDIAYIKNSAEFRYNLRLAHKLNLIDELLKPDAP